MQLPGELHALWRWWHVPIPTEGRVPISHLMESEPTLVEWHTPEETKYMPIITPREKAQAGVEMLKEAVLEVLLAHPEGVRHIEIVNILDLYSDYLGRQRNYLSWSVVGLLMNAGKIRREGDKYFLEHAG